MLFSQITTNIGEATSISLPCKYVAEPTQAFNLLTKNRRHSLLLESAEIDSKDDLKSIMLIDTAVTFECYGKSVVIEPVTSNGVSVVSYLKEQLAKLNDVAITTYPIKELTQDSTLSQTDLFGLKVTFSQIDLELDEEARLKQINAFEVLRTVVRDIKHSPTDTYATFLGGVFAYDMLANFETLPDVKDGFNTTPDYAFYLAETLMVIDHKNQTSEIIGNVFSDENVYQNCFTVGKRLETLKSQLDELEQIQLNTPSNTNGALDFSLAQVDVSDEQFKQQVIRLKNNIVQGDIFQVVPSRGFSLKCTSAMNAYKELKLDNPSPYMFYLKHPNFELFGASPESALKYDADNRQVEVYPIAGTRKRGFNPDGSIDRDLDSRIELDLRNDQKEVSEHTMLVDLARNDIARISNTGSRYVKDLLKVDRYSYVMHLVSRVVGTLKQDLDALHAYQACMNMGTLVGAPKIKAATLIRETEQARRGSYGGAVGYLNGNGDMDTCIVIRSAFVKDNIAFVQAGAGVVYDSDPQSEVEETSNKARAVIKAVLRAESQNG